MTIGVGGSTAEAEFARMRDLTADVPAIGVEEWRARVERAQMLMREKGISALYLDSSVNLFYFTGINLKRTERLHGAVIPAEGPVTYLSPVFEEPKTRTLLNFGDDIRGWEEHEDPTALVIETIASLGFEDGTVAVDPETPFFTFDGLRKAGNRYDFVNGTEITTPCRACKTAAEIALLKRSNEITIEVHKAAAAILREGITTTEVEDFVQEAYTRFGTTRPAGKPLIMFGEATAYPHGVPYPQTLKDGDMVLMDLGTFVKGYRSDITRTYVFGEPNARQREVWDLEKQAQSAGFAAATLGAPCENVDKAARAAVVGGGFGPDYALPGLPHRTGHGIGLDVHEEVYMVRGNMTPLAEGMCFSVEPTICIYGEFGIRLEDCAYMAADGAHWFTEPAKSIDDPFALDV
ncbi:Xaa-Pro dipeptidase [Breoghania corrubedonensis]|uniref:Xaa-Pro dipeptidase n=1 Tax=Breoghania corrubedonensis TaxID=665038 RepID=A0A2T5VGS5_9HYPH|nr:Xaa-Pro peptidase family protein [Breoghania corrubedonensis]PTW62926.1 Xaa-Pro dipeptidase [Breoghania corrubedonensis]